MNNQKKVNPKLSSVPLFRKIEEHSNDKKNIDVDKHKNSHCLDDFQKEINSLHLDAQNQYKKIYQSKNSNDIQENLSEDFMDPEWFARETENRMKVNLQKYTEESPLTLSTTSYQTKENDRSDNFSDQPTIEKFFPMGTMNVSTSKTSAKYSHHLDNEKLASDIKNRNTNIDASTLSFKFRDNPKEIIFADNEKQQKKKKLNKQLKNDFNKAQISNDMTHRTKSKYRSFLKWNLTIFITSFINIFFILFLCFTYLQTRYFPNLQTTTNTTLDIYRNFSIMSLLFAYQVASIHCGYTIVKHRLIKMKKTIKVLLYPILLIFILIIGLICEIPYYFISCFQLENDIPER